jgi:hypothetical protein
MSEIKKEELEKYMYDSCGVRTHGYTDLNRTQKRADVSRDFCQAFLEVYWCG